VPYRAAGKIDEQAFIPPDIRVHAHALIHAEPESSDEAVRQAEKYLRRVLDA